MSALTLQWALTALNGAMTLAVLILFLRGRWAGRVTVHVDVPPFRPDAPRASDPADG